MSCLPAPFSIKTPSIFASFRFGLLKALSCASKRAFTSAKLAVECFLAGDDDDEAVPFAFWTRGLRPATKYCYIEH
jgi:hypothetical protein